MPGGSRNSTDDAYIVLRMTSHFLEHVAPELESFKEANITDFQAPHGDDEGTQYQLLQMEKYEEFSKLFEDGMAAFIESSEYPMGDFSRILKKGLDDMKSNEDSMAYMLVELLQAVSDFEGFYKFMAEEEGKENDEDGWDMPNKDVAESKTDDVNDGLEEKV